MGAAQGKRGRGGQSSEGIMCSRAGSAGTLKNKKTCPELAEGVDTTAPQHSALPSAWLPINVSSSSAKVVTLILNGTTGDSRPDCLVCRANQTHCNNMCSYQSGTWFFLASIRMFVARIATNSWHPVPIFNFFFYLWSSENKRFGSTSETWQEII